MTGKFGGAATKILVSSNLHPVWASKSLLAPVWASKSLLAPVRASESFPVKNNSTRQHWQLEPTRNPARFHTSSLLSIPYYLISARPEINFVTLHLSHPLPSQATIIMADQGIQVFIEEYKAVKGVEQRKDNLIEVGS